MQNILGVISALAEASVQQQTGTLAKPARPVITISRCHGAGGEVIAEKLAQMMNLPVYDKEVLRDVATRMQNDPAVIKMLDDTTDVHRVKDMWLYRMFSGKDIGVEAYREALTNVIGRLARSGGILVGRGSHVILGRACALRVSVIGSPDACASRLSAEGKGTFEAMLAEVKQRTANRNQFLKDIFNADPHDPTTFDLTVNTDRIGDFDAVVAALKTLAVAVFEGKVLAK